MSAVSSEGSLLCRKFSIVPFVTTLSYNCWFKNKACPGSRYKRLSAIKEAFKIVVEKADTHMNSG
ncbi:hypothetical protein [Ruminiclostridium cellobioparum]|uniref:hypothetical protein n=1 Tax=Ruminiclostridium cellobioparum TaxID=29355 RepID=UPI0003491E3A|nr:hypothetical protein [Ruminiclostridium cellobioparum]